MIEINLAVSVVDRDGLVALLKTPEHSGGLGWPVDEEAPFTFVPEIAPNVKGASEVRVSRLVPATSDDAHIVLLAEFQDEYTRRDLRELLASVRREAKSSGRFADADLADTIFIVAKPGYADIRFVLFEERNRRLPAIRSFGWSLGKIGRTVLTHNLKGLVWSHRPDWIEAWDVEALTEKFYTAFEVIFKAVCQGTTHPSSDPETKKAYVLQLMNRMLFISFIERMGWLTTPDGETDYLHSLWRRHIEQINPIGYYQSIADPMDAPHSFKGLLNKLFFQGLNTEKGIGR